MDGTARALQMRAKYGGNITNALGLMSLKRALFRQVLDTLSPRHTEKVQKFF